MVPRHRVFCLLISTLLLLGAHKLAQAAAAQPYPNKPVRFIVANGAGSSDDFHVRVVAQKLTETLGQPFVVENRPGAGGLVGQTIAVNAPPDGYTIVLLGRSITAAPFVNANLSFDPQRAFVPVALLVTLSLALVVNPSVKASSVPEYISLARANPGKITVGDLGGGLMPTVASILFRGLTKVDLAPVSYKEFNQLVVDLIAGRVDSFFPGIQPVYPHIAAGKLRALGTTGTKRSSILPDVPTIAEAGVPGYDAGTWLFIAAPAGTPRAVIDRLNSAVTRVISMPDVHDSLTKVGSEPATSTSDELKKRVADATEQFGRVAKELGIKPR